MAKCTWARRPALRSSGCSLLAQVLQQRLIKRRGALHLWNVAAVVQHYRLGARDILRQRLAGGQWNQRIVATPDYQGRGFERAQPAVNDIVATQNGIDEAVDGIPVVLAQVLG